jgi:hypothetical protein
MKSKIGTLAILDICVYQSSFQSRDAFFVLQENAPPILSKLSGPRLLEMSADPVHVANTVVNVLQHLANAA